jgi:hypothetical protein
LRRAVLVYSTRRWATADANGMSKDKPDSTKRNANALMLFVAFCIAIPAVIYFTRNGGDLLVQVRVILGL